MLNNVFNWIQSLHPFKAPMFQGLSDGFLRMLSLEIKPSLYLPQQKIADRNEICHDMYFIQRGEIEVTKDIELFRSHPPPPPKNSNTDMKVK